VDVGSFEPTALMFQTGYLTVRTDRPPFAQDYFLGFPNLEVRASLIPLLLFSEKTHLKKPYLLFSQAKAILAALTERDERGFEASFSSFLSNLPYELHLPYEAYYHTVFILAMALAGQTVTAEVEAGDGRYDVHLKALTGDDYIIELKYLNLNDLEPLPTKKLNKNNKINKELAKKIDEAMNQIESKKYTKKFQGLGNRIFKSAVVISGRVDVKTVFEEAKNWTLVKTSEGVYQVLES
jgi:hypothetical protein